MRVYFVVVSKYNQIQIKLYSYPEKKWAYLYIIKNRIVLHSGIVWQLVSLSSLMLLACDWLTPLWPRPQNKNKNKIYSCQKCQTVKNII